MITSKKIVRHINQGVTEYWKHCSISGWVPENEFEAGEWPRGTFEYIELRHHMEPNKHGMFGPLIKM